MGQSDKKLFAKKVPLYYTFPIEESKKVLSIPPSQAPLRQSTTYGTAIKLLLYTDCTEEEKYIYISHILYPSYYILLL